MFQHINVGMDRTLSVAKSYLWSLVKFDNLNFVSVITKMFQHINMGMDRTLSVAKSLLWPLGHTSYLSPAPHAKQVSTFPGWCQQIPQIIL